MHYYGSVFGKDLYKDIEKAVADTASDWPVNKRLMVRNHLRPDVQRAFALMVNYVGDETIPPEKLAQIPIPSTVAYQVRVIISAFPHKIRRVMGTPEAPSWIVN